MFQSLFCLFTGMFGNIEIGRANANDPDDYDFKDKYYKLLDPDMEKFFRYLSVLGATFIAN